MFAQEGGKLSYLDNCLASSCVLLKRLFNKLVVGTDTRKYMYMYIYKYSVISLSLSLYLSD